MPASEISRRASRAVTLELLSSVAIVALLSGCWDDGDVVTYPANSYVSVEICATAPNMTAALCDKIFKQAQTEHTQHAPHYATLAACQKDFKADTCAPSPFLPVDPAAAPQEQASSDLTDAPIPDAHTFSPSMKGFLAFTGSMGQVMLPQPLYETADNKIVTPNGAEWDSTIGESGKLLKRDEVSVSKQDTVDSCVAEGHFTKTECEASHKKAEIAHYKNAPRFQSLQECEQEFGHCAVNPVAVSGATNAAAPSEPLFSPFMQGWLMRGMFYNPVYYPQPIYVHSSGGYVTSSGSSWTPSPRGSYSRASSSTYTAPSRPVVVDRGSSFAAKSSVSNPRSSFGSRSSMSSGGGSSSRGGFGATGRGFSSPSMGG